MQSPCFARGGRDSRSPSRRGRRDRSRWWPHPSFPVFRHLGPPSRFLRSRDRRDRDDYDRRPPYCDDRNRSCRSLLLAVGQLLLIWREIASKVADCRDGTWCFSLRATGFGGSPVVHRCKIVWNRQRCRRSQRSHEMSVTGSRPLDVHKKDLERSAESPPFGVWQVSLQTFKGSPGLRIQPFHEAFRILTLK